MLTEELGATKAAGNAPGWEVCLERLVTSGVGEDWPSRFERYSRACEPLLGPQAGPPVASHA